MYGAFIGDIVGSKYEFNNIKTKEFPLFSQGCDYTDDTIMTAAVAKAIMSSRVEQYTKNENGKGFQRYIIEAMQDFGRRYPNPTGAYGERFSKWLRQQEAEPYGSYGNGSAMRVSPCGLVAVTMDEALALARASACVTHNHPEGIKGAEAVSAAIFLAKCGKTKEKIRQYIGEHYYNLDFTMDSIRDSYKFDDSCRGSVPQAIVAFLESENFEDAIQNVISIGGDCDTTGAITGSIAWIYYAGYHKWVTGDLDSSMKKLKARATEYLPKEFVDIEAEFIEVCGARAGTYHRVGGCTSILNRDEMKKYGTDWDKLSVQREKASGGSHTIAADDFRCPESDYQKTQYTLQYIKEQAESSLKEKIPGACCVRYDKLLGKWHLKIQLDNECLWYLSVFLRQDGSLEKYSLDKETANDSHYEFVEEQAVRKKLNAVGEKDEFFHEILIRYVKTYGGNALLSQILPYVTAQFHF